MDAGNDPIPGGLMAHFTENRGQFGEDAGVLCTRGEGFAAAFGTGRVRYAVPGADGSLSVFDIVMVGANAVEPVGEDQLGHRTSYFIGNDPGAWVTGAVNYDRVRYPGIYDGVDLEFRYVGEALKYEFIVSPGGDPAEITMRYDGVEDLAIDHATGDLVVTTRSGTLRDSAPLSYQVSSEGALEVESGFSLRDGGAVGFRVDGLDDRLPLVIDPGLVFCTFVGCSDRDIANSMFVDGTGGVWVTGSAWKGDFPITPGAYQSQFSGGDAIVFRLDSNGSSLLYSTYIGGWSTDSGVDLHVDGSGHLYLVGQTTSDDFPVTSDAYCATLRGASDLFILRLDVENSTLLHSTLIGGGSWDTVYGCHVDGTGTVHTVGSTNSSDYPTTDGSFDTSYGGGYTDAFLTVYDMTTPSLEYSTLLGGTDREFIMELHVDEAGEVYMCGRTGSPGFPVTDGAYDTTLSGTSDAFVLKLNTTTSRLDYSTFLGGASSSEISGFVVDGLGRAYVGGHTFNPSFPTTEGAFDRHLGTWSDMFVLKLDETGSELLNATLLGEANPDYGGWLALDGEGDVYVAGTTFSREFPVTEDAFDDTYANRSDIVLARFDPNLTSLKYATYLGGEDDEWPVHIMADRPGSILLTGSSRSNGTFPTTPDAYATDINGYWEDIYVLRMDIDPPMVIDDGSDRNATTGDPFRFNVTVMDNLGVSSVAVQYWFGTSTPPIHVGCGLVSGTTTGGTWSSVVTVPDCCPGDLHYILEARDAADNTVSTDPTVVPVHDDDPPRFLSVDLPVSSTTGETITVKVEVRDNVGVDLVNMTYVYHWLPPSREHHTLEPVDVDPWGNGTYGVDIVIDAVHPGNHQITLSASDVHGNVNVSGPWWISVTDDDPPSFLEDLSPDGATTGDPFNVTIRVRDNVGLSGVWCHHWYGREHAVNSSMERGEMELWHLNLTIRHTPQVLHYLVLASDTSGNIVWNTQVDVEVRDNDPPEILEDRTAPTGTTGDPLTVTVESWDNLGVVDARVIYWFGEDDATSLEMVGEVEGGSGIWTFSIDIPVPSDLRGSFHYQVEVEDPTRNRNSTVERSVQILDDDPPELEHTHGELLVTKGLDCELHVTVRDNVGVGEVNFTYRFGEGAEESLPMEMTPSGSAVYCTVVIPVPRQAEGPLYYRFAASDTSGSTNTTGWYEGTCVNRPPELRGGPPRWDVTEGEVATLDLAEFVQDGNDPVTALSAHCTDPRVTATGLDLQARYDAWVPEHRVEVRVTDGEDSLWFNVTVRVTNVNDAPEIGSVAPENGSVFTEGMVVTFTAEATDEDGDDLAFTWREGTDVIGEGPEVDHDGLPVGEHTITLEVSDGTATATLSLTVVIEEEDVAIPSLSILLVLLVVLAVVVLVTYVMRNSVKEG